MYYTLEENQEGYIVHLPDGAELRITVTDDGLSDEMVRIDGDEERVVYPSGLSIDLRQYVLSETDKGFSSSQNNN